MYSYEDRARAVALYIKLGRRVALTIQQLGYPAKNSLRSWHREFVRSSDLPTGYIRSKSKYSDEQKKLAVEQYLKHGCCLAATVKALGFPAKDTLHTWIVEQHPETKNTVAKKQIKLPRRGVAVDERTDELKRCA